MHAGYAFVALVDAEGHTNFGFLQSQNSSDFGLLAWQHLVQFSWKNNLVTFWQSLVTLGLDPKLRFFSFSAARPFTSSVQLYNTGS